MINLLQTLIETLFLYHPTVWWLSHQIRIERENCCDDHVVATFANQVEYGRALLAVEELRNTEGASSALALNAKGDLLLTRVRRLVGEPSRDDRSSSAGPFTLVAIVFLCVSLPWHRPIVC